MKPVDVMPNKYIDFCIEKNVKDSKFEVADHVRISKYENILQKLMFQISLKKFLWLKKPENEKMKRMIRW